MHVNAEVWHWKNIFLGLPHCNPKGISGMMCIEHISCGVALNFSPSYSNSTNRCMNSNIFKQYQESCQTVLVRGCHPQTVR